MFPHCHSDSVQMKWRCRVHLVFVSCDFWRPLALWCHPVTYIDGNIVDTGNCCNMSSIYKTHPMFKSREKMFVRYVRLRRSIAMMFCIKCGSDTVVLCTEISKRFDNYNGCHGWTRFHEILFQKISEAILYRDSPWVWIYQAVCNCGSTYIYSVAIIVFPRYKSCFTMRVTQ